MTDEEYRKERYSDFMIKLYKGAVIPKEAPNYNKNRRYYFFHIIMHK